jgi:hypothetical protein
MYKRLKYVVDGRKGITKNDGLEEKNYLIRVSRDMMEKNTNNMTITDPLTRYSIS